MCRLLACLVFAGLAGPAFACINDPELATHEREFRSQYRDPYSPSSPPSKNPAEPADDRPLIWAGAILLAGAAALTLTGGRQRKVP